ncbi:MFS transporter, partial [Rhizobiaceae sp. 2RAB30]
GPLIRARGRTLPCLAWRRDRPPLWRQGTVLAGLLMMLAGELLMAASPSWSVEIAGRLTAGIGGVLLNVLWTKMVADWFTGRKIATAMAIFINSWPAGIAISLLLPTIGATFGLHVVNLAVAVLDRPLPRLVGLSRSGWLRQGRRGAR